MTTGWLQLLLVGVPVLIFIGAWMTLRHITKRPQQRKDQ